MPSIFKVGDRWRAQVRRKGHPTLSENFKTKQDAQRWAREKEHEIDKGKSTPAGVRLTVGGIIQRYRDSMTEGKLGRDKKLCLTRLKKHLDDVRLDELDNQKVLNYAALRELEGCGPASLQNEISYLRVALRYGGVLCEAGEATALAMARLTLTTDFLRHADRVKSSDERDRRPTVEELEKLEAYFAKRRSPTPMWDIILFAMATSLRQGEIVGPGGITWEDLNVKHRTIKVRDRKDPNGVVGNDEIIPLLKGPVVWQGCTLDPIIIINRAPTANHRSGRIFPYAEGTVSGAFGTACKKLKIEDLHFHDLRHESVSRMFEHGMQIPEVAMVSGHKDWKNLKRYTNLKPSFVHDKLVTLK